MKEYYDFVCSLGGSCAIAKQLKFKGLRKESLPFDWLFHLDDRPLRYLIKAFKTNFDDFLLLTSLRELTEDERGDSACFQYKDEISGYNFIHDFQAPKEECYDNVLMKYKRRIRRLEERLFSSSDVLLILDARYKVDIYLLKEIKKCVEFKYGCRVDFVLLQFFADHDGYAKVDGGGEIFYRKRGHSIEDYNGEPEVYEFIRHIKLRENASKLYKIFRIIKSKFVYNLCRICPLRGAAKK